MIDYIYKVVWNENDEENIFDSYKEARKFVDSCWKEQENLEDKKYVSPFIYEVEVEIDEKGNQVPTGNEKAVFTYDSGEPKESDLSQPKLFDDSKYDTADQDKVYDELSKIDWGQDHYFEKNGNNSNSYQDDWDKGISDLNYEIKQNSKKSEKPTGQLSLFDALDELDEVYDNIEKNKDSRRKILEAALDKAITEDFDDEEEDFEYEEIPDEVFFGEDLYKLGYTILIDIDGNKISAEEESDLIEKIIDYAFNDFAKTLEGKSPRAIYDPKLAAKRYGAKGNKSERICDSYGKNHPMTHCRAFGLTEDDIIVSTIKIDNNSYTLLMINPNLEIINKDQILAEYEDEFTGEDPRSIRGSDKYDGRYEDPEYLAKHPEQDVNNLVKAEESLEDTVEKDLNDNRAPKQPKEPEVESEPYNYKEEEIKAKRLDESSSQEIEEYYKEFEDEFGVDLHKLVKEFMDIKYPIGLPEFAGDIIYSEKYWNEFEQWLKKDKKIDLDKLEEDVEAGVDSDVSADLVAFNELFEDARIVPCKRYKAVAHCPEETNVDCNLEKPALEKPLAGDNIDSKKFYKLEESKNYTNKSLREGFNNEEFKRFAAACKALGFVKLSDINKFAVEKGITSDKDLLSELEKAVAEKKN